MPKLIPTISVVVRRGDKTIRLNPNDKKPFDFTEDEVRDILAADPDGLRKPINEGGEQAATPAPDSGKGGKAKPADKTETDM